MSDKDKKFSIRPIPGSFVIDSQTQKVVHDANALNEALRQLRQGITVKIPLSSFDYSVPPPEGASWSFEASTVPAKIVEGTITPVTSTDAQPQEPLTLDAMMDAVSALPAMPDPTPLRANLWTLDRLRKAFPDAKGTAQNWFGLVFGGVAIKVDTSLPDGVVMQGDKVLCNIKEGKE